jgi:hypothetical protein
MQQSRQGAHFVDVLVPRNRLCTGLSTKTGDS